MFGVVGTGLLSTFGSSGGLFVSGIASAQGVRWTSLLLEHELDDSVRARLLVSGAFAAISAGSHHLVEGWSEEAAALSRDREPAVESIAATGQATPLMLRSPGQVPTLLARARDAAGAAGSDLCRGLADAWAIVADFCVSPQSASAVDPLDATRFGGPHSRGWGVARYVGVAMEALRGRLEVAIELARSGTELAVVGEMSGIHSVLATARPRDGSRVCPRRRPARRRALSRRTGSHPRDHPFAKR